MTSMQARVDLLKALGFGCEEPCFCRAMNAALMSEEDIAELCNEALAQAVALKTAAMAIQFEQSVDDTEPQDTRDPMDSLRRILGGGVLVSAEVDHGYAPMS